MVHAMNDLKESIRHCSAGFKLVPGLDLSRTTAAFGIPQFSENDIAVFGILPVFFNFPRTAVLGGMTVV